MGLAVINDMRVFEGKALVGYSFNHGNEYTLYMEDADGMPSRIRIPSVLKDLLLDFYDVHDNGIAAPPR